VEAQRTSICSSVDEDDRSMVQSLPDDSAIDSDLEDVSSESYEVLCIVCFTSQNSNNNNNNTNNTKFVKRRVAMASEALANSTVKKHRRRRTNVL